MDIQFHGANCLTITHKQVRVVVDDNLTDLGAKSVVKPGDIVLFTDNTHPQPSQQPKIIIDQPGEYEVSGVSVYGIAARAHIDAEGQKNATIYKMLIDDVRLLVVGHIYPELSDTQLESIGMVDCMFIPVGGNGYTLDGIGALKIIKKIEPKLIIPTHYDSSHLNFPVSQQTLEQACKNLAMEPKEPLAKLKLRSGELGDGMQLITLLES